ncbi:hypothetical protein [Bradyrhizobium liaoningense]|uniref:hypothetical protein n=1 Tax=Bradyrhizobium liaoningense TaxID=43992 RepID=UPI001BA4F669|nr:hypothetical protein [Bradyrhizobium liaoningense]MBR0706981.1 hypothetical protein [Bradyrhizobium liaoningense]
MTLRDSILGALTTNWLSGGDIERRLDWPADVVRIELQRLVRAGAVWRFTDIASGLEMTNKYCLPHDVSALTIPRHERRSRCVDCQLKQAAEAVNLSTAFGARAEGGRHQGLGLRALDQACRRDAARAGSVADS